MGNTMVAIDIQTSSGDLPLRLAVIRSYNGLKNII